jgi:hypothetical protein
LANLVALLIVFPLLFAEKRRALLDDIDSTLRAVAFMARSALPADYHDRIEGPGSVSDAAYEEIVSRNNQLCAAIGLEYIWSVMHGGPYGSCSPRRLRLTKSRANRRHAAFFERTFESAPYLKALRRCSRCARTNVDKWWQDPALPAADIDVARPEISVRVQCGYQCRGACSVRSAAESLALCLIFFGINMILGRWIGQKIFGPLERLTVVVQAISQGNRMHATGGGRL